MSKVSKPYATMLRRHRAQRHIFYKQAIGTMRRDTTQSRMKDNSQSLLNALAARWISFSRFLSLI
jgi:hypothetical protein